MSRIVPCFIAALCLSVSACQQQPPEPVNLDVRTPIALPPEAVEAVRAEMRMMLTSLNELHRGIATGDSALAARAAAASGVAGAEDPALESLLPEEFMRLGLATHSGFDSLAQAINTHAPADSIMSQLARITTNCVACHAIYRLTPAD